MKETTKFRKYSFFTILKISILIIILILLSIAIAFWTTSLKNKQELQNERVVLQKVLEREGHQGLLELAGARVHDIFYGEQGMSVVSR